MSDSQHTSTQIVEASSEPQFAEARTLFGELAELDLDHVRRLGLSVKVARALFFSPGTRVLPGDYAPPEGRLLLATVDGRVAGCGGYRRIDPGTCELKRMYVRPEFRGRRVGRMIADSLITSARAAGYRRILLETTTYLLAAQALYASIGFRPRELYADAPKEFAAITIAMELVLSG